MKNPANRRFLRAQKKEKSQSFGLLSKGLVFKILVPIILLLGIIFFVKLNTKYWNGNDKVSFAFIKGDGNVGVTVLDPKLSEMTTLTIPGETQVDVARNYGTLRLKNVWQLSQNEKLGGLLLPETITQNFFFPTTLWSSTDLSDIYKFIFSTDKTNISFGDRLSIGLFALKVGDLNKTEIDLAKSQFLHKEKLNDGLVGYTIMDQEIIQRLGVYFSDNEIADKNFRVYIADATGQPGVAQLVGQIIEVLGGKIVSIDRKQDVVDSDCQILGSDSNFNKKIATLFSCNVITGKTDFDLEVRLGARFAKRF